MFNCTCERHLALVTLSPPLLTESHHDCTIECVAKSSSPALCCVACILEGDEDRQKKSILKHRPLPILQDLLSAEDNAIIVYACEAIASILALGQNQIQAVIQHQIFPPLIELLAWDNAFISDEVVKAFRAAVSNGTPDQIRVLVGNGCIGPLCGLLDGDYPDTVLETLKVLGKILHAGANHNGMNPMAAEVVEQGEIAKLRALRRHDNPGIQAGAAAILRTFFGFEEESESGSESDESGKLDEDNGDEVESGAESESDADEIEDGDDAEPPRQRPRIA